MRIRWTLAATDDLQQIHDYLREHEPHLAGPTVIAMHERFCPYGNFLIVAGPGRWKGPASCCTSDCHISLLIALRKIR
jgi:hypothetical protein